jgi:hypothetical protein
LPPHRDRASDCGRATPLGSARSHPEDDHAAGCFGFRRFPSPPF